MGCCQSRPRGLNMDKTDRYMSPLREHNLDSKAPTDFSHSIYDSAYGTRVVYDSVVTGYALGASTTTTEVAAIALQKKRERRAVILGESIQPAPYSSPSKKYVDKTTRSRAMLESFCSQHFLFRDLPDRERDEAIALMTSREVLKGEVLIRQYDKNDENNFFYIVESGQFEIYVCKLDEKAFETQSNTGYLGDKVGECLSGGSFGELALLYNCSRAASVKAAENSVVWALHRRDFRKIVTDSAHKRNLENFAFLRGMDIFKQLTEQQLMAVAEALFTYTFNDGDYIVRQGERGEVFYIIKEGTCKRTQYVKVKKAKDNTTIPDAKKEQIIGKLEPGDHFGERSLVSEEPRDSNVVAIGRVTTLALDKNTFSDILGNLSDVLVHNEDQKTIDHIPIFASLHPNERAKLAAALKTITFKAGQLIIRQGEAGEYFYVIRDGTVKCFQTRSGQEHVLGELSTHSWFGEDALLEGDVRTNSVVAVTDVVCGALLRRDFRHLLGPLRHLIDRESRRRMKQAENSLLKLDRLRTQKILGVGSFGKVTLVTDEQTTLIYALKCLRKAVIVSRGQEKNVVREKQLMETLDHPFIVRLIRTFRDEQNVYLLLEYVPGGEMFYMLQKRPEPHLDASAARFYAACLLLALEHMHGQNVIYRDLKTENICLDQLGYPKLVDFGFAKRIDGKTYTLCGTPEYMSPEILRGQGHNKGADYWALGCLIYELVVGYTPFRGKEDDGQVALCRRILAGKYSFPPTVADPVIRDLVQRLLHPDPSRRLGCLKGGAEDVKRHPWFRSLDWQELVQQRLPAPYRPMIKDPLDTSNFDIYTEEDFVHLMKHPEPSQSTSEWDAEF
eukprot:GILK01008380.1.p1 GENE.GILK01008380.1~~GILK01008380.1.p1  ORF type:complete len:843 (-),score=95.85 GILK01008380.1:168-2696(-)